MKTDVGLLRGVLQRPLTVEFEREERSIEESGGSVTYKPAPPPYLIIINGVEGKGLMAEFALALDELEELKKENKRLERYYKALIREAEILAETTMQQEQMLQNLGAFK